MYCKDCKFWRDRPNQFQDDTAGVKKCERVRMLYDSTEWDEDCNRVLTGVAKNDKAFVQDGSDYKAELLTLGDFGCIQFQVKE